MSPNSISAHSKFNLAVLLTVFAFVLFVLTMASPRQAATNAAAGTHSFAALPAAAQNLVNQTIGRNDTTYHAVPTANGFVFNDDAHALNATFDAQGAHFYAADAQWDLRLTRWGRGDTLFRTNHAQWRADANRLTSAHDTMLTEWYVNGPAGLEQGLTLNEPPPARASDALTFAFDLPNYLRADINAAQDSMMVRTADGQTAFLYQGLQAYDAAGRALRAWLEIDAQTAALLIRVDDTNAQYPIVIDPFVQSATLTASDGAAYDYLGNSVAISSDGTTLAVGARGDDSAKGSVYVFHKGLDWVDAALVAKLTNSSGTADDQLGYAVDISADGSTIIAGASMVNSNGPGYACIFVRPGASWSNLTSCNATLLATTGANKDAFGYAVGISDDGDTVLVSARYATYTASQGPGDGHIFVKPGGGWTGTPARTAWLRTTSVDNGEGLGYSADLSGDGTTAVLGAYAHTVGSNAAQGAAFVFVKPGSSWSDMTLETAMLTASDGAANDRLGVSVSINTDASVIAAGAEYATVGTNSQQGKVYVFTKPGGGWANGNQAAILTAATGAWFLNVGDSVAVSGDGATILAGSPSYSQGRGGLYVFNKGAGWANGTEAQILSVTGATAGDGLGTGAASLDSDGDTAVGGAYYATINSNTAQGAAYVFQLPPPCSASITVANNGDTGAGSLRQAIADVCDGGTIDFDNDYAITLGSQLEVSKSVTITGATRTISISGADTYRVFNIGSSIDVTLNTLTITHGKATEGSGIKNAGTLTVISSTVSNSIADWGGSTGVGTGGGIYNNGTLTVTNSTLSSNTGYEGGGLFNLGTLTVINSTLSGNATVPNTHISEFEAGGGLYTQGASPVNIYNSTFSGNTTGNQGGGLYSTGTDLNLYNTILANSTNGDCVGTAAIATYNLIEDTGANACGLTDGANGNLIGVDPELGALQDNSGPTYTMALLPNSLAIDSGDNTVCAAVDTVNNLDQRGIARPQMGTCDIGAFESRGFTLTQGDGGDQTTVINTAFANPLAATISSAYSEPVNGGSITLTAPDTGASTNPAIYTPTITSGAISQIVTANSTTGSYNVTASIRGDIAGVGAGGIDIQGPPVGVTYALTNTNVTAPSVLTKDATTLTHNSATLNGEVNPIGNTATITFEYGIDTSYGAEIDAVPPSASGVTSTTVQADLSGLNPNTTYHFRVVAENAGGLTNGDDKQFTTDCVSSAITVSNNNDTGAGSLRQAINDICPDGTIDFGANQSITLGGELTIPRNMTITGAGHTISVSGNNASRVFNVNSSTQVTLDTLTVTGGLCNECDGGGISNSGTLTVTNSTIHGNTARLGGGIGSDGPLTLINSTFTGNTANNSAQASNSGGGIWSNNTVHTYNVTIADNTGGGIYLSTGGAGTLANTLVANHTAGDCATLGATLTADAYNMDSDGTCDNATQKSVFEIGLGILQNNGGNTDTLALDKSSTAVDAGDDAVCADTTTVKKVDQRGSARNDLHCDVGAFEYVYTDGDTIIKPLLNDNDAASFGPTLAIVTVTTGAPIDISTTRTTGAAPGNNPPPNTLSIEWDLKQLVNNAARTQAPSANGFSLQTTFCFDPTDPNQYNGQDKNKLHVMHWNGLKWDDLGGTWSVISGTQTDFDCITAASPLTSLSPIVLAPINPTATDVAGFKGAVNTHGAVVLRWKTTTETRIAGFDIFRQTGKGEWKQLNAEMRQAKHAGDALGDKYRFTDKTVKAGKTYRYKIRIVYLDGQTAWTNLITVKR